MRLSVFIEENRVEIIEEWVKFAKTLEPWSTGMSDNALRDHAGELVSELVADMQSTQTEQEASDKSKGHGFTGRLGRVGQKHASERLETGQSLEQLVSEYRALRATVLRLWEAKNEQESEINRFNEAIDETLAESVSRYSDTVTNTREQFVAILGHDLRNPLGAVSMGARILLKAESLTDQQARIASKILSSADRMSRMVNDLLDLASTRLGSGIPVVRKPMKLDAVCAEVITELEMVHASAKLRLVTEGDLEGEWDGDRLAQVLSNLVANALQYGGESGTVNVTARRAGEDVLLEVHNQGPAIPEKVLRTLFEPMVRHQLPGEAGLSNVGGLGLGLFIVKEIVTAHGGTIQVTSNEATGTTFTAQLPRKPSADKLDYPRR